MFLLCIIGNIEAQRVEIERKWAEIKATPKSKFLCYLWGLWRRMANDTYWNL